MIFFNYFFGYLVLVFFFFFNGRYPPPPNGPNLFHFLSPPLVPFTLPPPFFSPISESTDNPLKIVSTFSDSLLQPLRAPDSKQLLRFRTWNRKDSRSLFPTLLTEPFVLVLSNQYHTNTDATPRVSQFYSIYEKHWKCRRAICFSGV